MKLQTLLISSILALAACGGNTTGNFGSGGGGEEGEEGGGIGGGGDTPPAPTGDTCAGAYVCSGDVVAVSYDQVNDILSITGTPFDERELAGTYVRAGDINGIPAYVNDDPLRFNDYLAYHTTSAGGEVSVGAVGIEGYQDFGYSGTFILLTDPANVPSTGLVGFQGNVAGILVYEGAGDLDSSEGVVTMEVDFTDNRIKGFVEGRTSTSGIGTLPSTLVLNDTTIVNGSFTGTVNSYDGPDTLESGSYGGSFAGDGSVIGGFFEAINSDFATDITSRDTGVFIATECDPQPCP